MKAIIKFGSLFLFVLFHSSCAFVITERSIEKSANPNPDKAYVYGRLFVSRELTPNWALLLERAVRVNVPVHTHLKFHSGEGFYFVELIPGKYALPAIEHYSDFLQLKATQSLSKNEFTISANAAYYLGDIELRAKYEIGANTTNSKMVPVFNNTGLCRLTNKFEESTRLLLKMYPEFSNIKTVDSRLINENCNVSVVVGESQSPQ